MGEHAGAGRLRSPSILYIGLLAVLAVCVAATSVGAQAIFQDQAANFKWYEQNIGLVQDVHFPAGPSKTAILSTEAGIITSLNLRNNKIAWRNLLPNNEVAEVFVTSEDGHVVFTVSGNGKHASLWNVVDGSLLWSQDLYSFADMTDEKLAALQQDKDILVSAKFIKDLNNDRADDLLVSVYDRVHLLSGKGGVTLWSWTAPNDGKVHQAYIARVKRSVSLVVLGTTEKENGSEYFVALLDPATGEPTSEDGPFRVALPASAKLGKLSECVWVGSASILFCFDANGKDLWHAGIDPLHPFGLEFKRFPYTGGFEAEELEGPKSIIGYPNGLIVRVSNRDVIYGIKGLAMGTVHQYPKEKTPRIYGSFVRVEKRPGYEGGLEDMEVTYLAAASTTETGITIDVIDCDARKVVHVINDESITTSNHGSVRKVFPNVISKKDGSMQFRVLVVSQDHSLSLASGDKFLWTREEALAGIVQAEIIELPAPLALREALQKEFGNEDTVVSVPIIGDFLKRISADAHQLLTLVGVLGEKKDGAGEGHQGENDEALTKDRFGLRKLVVVTTQSGKVYALHSTDGSIAWSKFVRDSTPLSLFLSRSSSHPPPVGVIVARDTTSGAGRILQVNLLTGEEVEDATTLDYAVKQSVVLPYTDSTFRHPVLVFDAANQGHIVPDTQENRNLVAANADKIHIYLVDKEKASVEGYGIDGDITKPMTLLWNVYFSSSSEVVEAIAPSRSLSVGLPVLIRGDNSVTPKYLNKNLLAVATSSSNTFVSSTNKRVLETTVGIYLIDTVTGAVVFHTYHKNAQGPVNLVQGDNWVVYHLWNRKLHRFEMSVLDLFEPQMNWKETTFSARTAPLPQVASQSYVFNSGIKAMATTNTARGLTQKQIMVGMSSDRLLGIDKRFVDFRRKPKELLTEDDKNEGVIPYMPELLFRASDILNQNNTIFGLRGIQTAPTYLESTSLVFAWGVDLFYTRVTPSGAFDMLNEDFEYYPLLATVIAVVVLTVVTSFLVASKKLREAWQ